jgi:hypothetical protein
MPDALPPPTPDKDGKLILEPSESNPENCLLVFTAAHHLNPGYCCGSGWRRCPYGPWYLKGDTAIHSL